MQFLIKTVFITNCTINKKGADFNKILRISNKKIECQKARPFRYAERFSGTRLFCLLFLSIKKVKASRGWSDNAKLRKKNKTPNLYSKLNVVFNLTLKYCENCAICFPHSQHFCLIFTIIFTFRLKTFPATYSRAIPFLVG